MICGEQILFCTQLAKAKMSCNQLTFIDSATYLLIKIYLPNVTAMSFYNMICDKQNAAIYILPSNAVIALDLYWHRSIVCLRNDLKSLCCSSCYQV